MSSPLDTYSSRVSQRPLESKLSSIHHQNVTSSSGDDSSLLLLETSSCEVVEQLVETVVSGGATSQITGVKDEEQKACTCVNDSIITEDPNNMERELFELNQLKHNVNVNKDVNSINFTDSKFLSYYGIESCQILDNAGLKSATFFMVDKSKSYTSTRSDRCMLEFEGRWWFKNEALAQRSAFLSLLEDKIADKEQSIRRASPCILKEKQKKKRKSTDNVNNTTALNSKLSGSPSNDLPSLIFELLVQRPAYSLIYSKIYRRNLPNSCWKMERWDKNDGKVYFSCRLQSPAEGNNVYYFGLRQCENNGEFWNGKWWYRSQEIAKKACFTTFLSELAKKSPYHLWKSLEDISLSSSQKKKQKRQGACQEKSQDENTSSRGNKLPETDSLNINDDVVESLLKSQTNFSTLYAQIFKVVLPRNCWEYEQTSDENKSNFFCRMKSHAEGSNVYYSSSGPVDGSGVLRYGKWWYHNKQNSRIAAFRTFLKELLKKRPEFYASDSILFQGQRNKESKILLNSQKKSNQESRKSNAQKEKICTDVCESQQRQEQTNTTKVLTEAEISSVDRLVEELLKVNFNNVYQHLLKVPLPKYCWLFEQTFNEEGKALYSSRMNCHMEASNVYYFSSEGPGSSLVEGKWWYFDKESSRKAAFRSFLREIFKKRPELRASSSIFVQKQRNYNKVRKKQYSSTSSTTSPNRQVIKKDYSKNINHYKRLIDEKKFSICYEQLFETNLPNKCWNISCKQLPFVTDNKYELQEWYTVTLESPAEKGQEYVPSVFGSGINIEGKYYFKSVDDAKKATFETILSHHGIIKLESITN